MIVELVVSCGPSCKAKLSFYLYIYFIFSYILLFHCLNSETWYCCWPLKFSIKNSTFNWTWMKLLPQQTLSRHCMYAVASMRFKYELLLMSADSRLPSCLLLYALHHGAGLLQSIVWCWPWCWPALSSFFCCSGVCCADQGAERLQGAAAGEGGGDLWAESREEQHQGEHSCNTHLISDLEWKKHRFFLPLLNNDNLFPPKDVLQAQKYDHILIHT